MSNRTSPLLPATARRLRELGGRIRLARQRRKLTAGHVAERAGMSPMTLRGIERGGPGVTLGAYAAVLQVLGLDGDIDLLGAQDPLGRELQDSRLSGGSARGPAGVPAEPPRRATRKVPGVSDPDPSTAPTAGARPRIRPAPDPLSPGGIAAEDLAGLIAPAPSGRRKP